jgi:predicted ATPase
MLDEFRVDNFKSLINVVFRPHERNLLLGVNNAGKTNLCQALRFVTGTVFMPLADCANRAAGGVFGLRNYYFEKPTIDFEVKARLPYDSDLLSFQYGLTISLRARHPSPPTVVVDREVLSVTGGGFEATLLENTPSGVTLLDEPRYLRRDPSCYSRMSTPSDTTMLQRLFDLEANARANRFKQFLSHWQYYALSTSAIRGFAHRPNNPFLFEDGGNLASVIYQLKTTNERSYRRLLRELQKMDPSIELINFVAPSEEGIFMIFEDKKGNQLPAANASHGTLRFLALLYILQSQPALALNPLIIVEEPENGIYVRFLRELFGSATNDAGAPQLIFTSHSPYFIDLFDDEVESIFVMKRGEYHSSITQPDVGQVKKRLETFPLGEQHFRGMLE